MMEKLDRKAFYRLGYKLSSENSNSLVRVSELSANERFYGIACSLNILAAEEAIKAALLLINSFLLNYEIVDLNKIFIHHKVKHNLIKDHIKLFDDFFDKDKKFYDSYKQLFELIEILPDTILSSISTEIEFLKRTKKLTEEYDLTKNEIESALKWAENANSSKNRGFYIDLKGERWLSPEEFTLKQFKTEIKYTQTIVKWVQIMEFIFDTPGIEKFIENNH